MRKYTIFLMAMAIVMAIAVNATAKAPRSTARKANTVRVVHPKGVAVDLGLSVKWADRNLGAAKSSDFGSYYAWGELKPKKEFYDSLCTTWDRNFDYQEICGDTLFDAATVSWGDKWRMPSSDEVKALVDSCSWVWTTVDKTHGYRVTGPSGKSIFIPASGFMMGKVRLYDDITGYYWCGEPIGTRLSAIMLFDSDSHEWFSFQRSCGLPIRPVSQ